MFRRPSSGLLSIALLLPMPVAVAQTITELNATNAARNEMVNRTANDAPAPAPAQPAPAPAARPATPPPAHGMKYTLSYALVAMLIGLGANLVCRPSHRHEPD
ncbi:MAG: hypothetical protein ACKO40_09695 [Planctomycetaceae bacterium]